MPIRYRKKTRKLRGRKTAGYGSKKKHRGKGSSGGKGWGGSTKNKRSYVYVYAPDHFGHKGFRPPYGEAADVVINVDAACRLAEKLGVKELDLGEQGYTKLLGRGKAEKAVTIKVKRASASAIEAVKKAGGNVIVEQVSEKKEAKQVKDEKEEE